MSLRVIILVGLIFTILLIIVGNTQKVIFRFIFWESEFELYKLLLSSMILGILSYWLYAGRTSAFRVFKKIRNKVKSSSVKE